MTPTTLQQELDAHRRLRIRPQQAQLAPLLEANIHREFAPPEEHETYQNRRLSDFVRFAAAKSPYHEKRFADSGIDPASVTDRVALRRLAIMTKADLHVNESRIMARALPRGHEVRGWAHSTGTSGVPSRVLLTQWANAWFSILSVRSLRWHRFDPMTKAASIRRGERNNVMADNTPGHRDRWPYVGSVIETGPETSLNYLAPVERLLDWLRKERPAYLRCRSQSLEHLALAAGELPVDSLRGINAYAEQLTPNMRRHIESTFGLRVTQGYGLNEIGFVAERCAAGRYHVHVEHAMVEITDDNGEPVAPDEVGRVIVTGYNNHAMPLIRYDTGDLAQAVDGACPCGVTLPTFGEVIGRYQRIAHVPAGTMQCFDVIEDALTFLPRHLIANLRQFQVHQRRDMTMELRLVTVGPLPQVAIDRLQKAMATSRPDPAWQLEIRYVDRIERRHGGKSEEFTSEFIPYGTASEPVDPELPSA